MARFTYCCALLFALVVAGCSDDSSGPPPELPTEVTAQVGEKGGTLQAKGMTLEIPPGALDKTVEISAKSTTQMAPKETGAKQVSDMYVFGPEGTKFNKEVKVTFQNKTDDPKAEVYFTKEDSDEFEKIDSEKSGQEVTAHVKHFSRGFLGVPLEEGLDAGEEDAGEEDAGEQEAGETSDASEEMDAGADGEIEAAVETDAETSDDGSATGPDATQVPTDAGPDTGPQGRHIAVHSRDRFGLLVNQTWAAFQDGQGAWQALTAPTTTGVYQFDVLEPSFAIAFVCSSPDRVDSWNTITYSASSNTTFDVVTQGPPCTAGTAPVEHTLVGTLNLGSNRYWRVGYSHLSSGINFASGSTTVTLGDLFHNEQTDILFATGPETDAGPSGYIINRFLVRRDITLTANLTGQNFDMVKDGVDAGVVAQADVLNANEITDVNVRYLTRDTDQGLLLNADTASGDTTRSVPFTTLPASARDPADRYLVEGSYETQFEWRKASLASQPSGNLSVTMPDTFPVVFASLDTPYLRPSFQFSPVASASVYTFSVAYSPERSSLHTFEIELQPGWIQSSGSVTLTFPDFSALQGFETGWVAPTGDSIAAKAAVHVRSTGASGDFKSESGQAATVPPPILTQ